MSMAATIAVPDHAEAKRLEPSATVTQQDIRSYFDGSTIGFWSAHEIWQRRIFIVEILSAFLGLGMIIQAAWASWQITHAINRELFEQLSHHLDMLLPGLLLCLLAAYPRTWALGWELPAFIFASVACADLLLFKLGEFDVSMWLLVGALVAILLGVVLRLLQRRTLFDLDEAGLDAFIDACFSRKIAESTAEIPFPSSGSEQTWSVILKTIPESDRFNAPPPRVRVGTRDRRMRVNPLGVAAFDLRSDTFVCLEGAIDLRTEVMLYTRVQEIPYTDIIAILWSSESAPGMEPKRTRFMPRRIRIGGKRKVSDASDAEAGQQNEPNTVTTQLRRDTFAVKLAGQPDFLLKFRDSELLPSSERNDSNTKPVESSENVRKLWSELSERRMKTGSRYPA